MNATLIMVKLLQVLYLIGYDHVQPLPMDMHPGQWLPPGSVRTPSTHSRERIVNQTNHPHKQLKLQGPILQRKRDVSMSRNGDEIKSEI